MIRIQTNKIGPWKEEFGNGEHMIINYIRDKYGFDPLDVNVFNLFFEIVNPNRRSEVIILVSFLLFDYFSYE